MFLLLFSVPDQYRQLFGKMHRLYLVLLKRVKIKSFSEFDPLNENISRS